MKVVVYCQHVLGIGHFFRTLAVCRALASHEVLLVTGGPPVRAALPDRLRVIRLPGLEMNREFKGLRPSEPGAGLEAVKTLRRRTLAAIFEREAPDLCLLEFYPFGRKAFRFEIDPVLEGISEGRLPPARVVCSLRDILVEREDADRYEARVVRTLNRWFHGVLVHGDPRLVRLEETFVRTADIRVPVAYTGYVTLGPPGGSRRKLRRRLGLGEKERLLVVSAGGGKVGERLFESVLDALPRMGPDAPVRCHLFTGPYLEQRAFDRLASLAGPRVRVRRFSDHFPAHLAAADLSVSMAGYNTCMNVLAAGTPALVWPFGRNREQSLRARRLEEKGALTVLDDGDLDPGRLAARMAERLAAGRPATAAVDIDGAARSAGILERWAAGEPAPEGGVTTCGREEP